MEVLFIGVASTDKTLNDINKKYYNGIPQIRPQQYFDFDLVSGISENCNVHALSLPAVSAYPNSKCLVYRGKKEKVSKSLKIDYIPLINIPLIKTILIMLIIFFKTILYIMNNFNKERVILCGYVSFETSIPALLVSKFTNTSIYTVVPDVSLYSLNYSSNQKYKYVKKIISMGNSIIEKAFHGYIFLTEEMNNLINQNRKKYIVVEGMIDTDKFKTVDQEKSFPRIIMYAGTLHEKFGIKKLVDAFLLADIPNCELWIFGSGDYAEKIKLIAKEIDTIKFKGKTNKHEILSYEKKATLLINPRPSNEEFTKYSFPSKTLEYMASGTPLLTTRLAGIPKEYEKYLYYFEKESSENMSLKIKEIMEYPPDELNRFGENAKKFVLECKNNKIQTKKIYNFLLGK